MKEIIVVNRTTIISLKDRPDYSFLPVKVINQRRRFTTKYPCYLQLQPHLLPGYNSIDEVEREGKTNTSVLERLLN